jgi:hypothetical protein
MKKTRSKKSRDTVPLKGKSEEFELWCFHFYGKPESTVLLYYVKNLKNPQSASKVI